MSKSSNTLVIYQKPTCSTCRETVKLARAAGADHTTVNYYERRFTKPQLKGLIKKAGLKARDVLRTKEEIYKKLNLAKKDLTEDQLVDLMVKYPDLIQRPIVEKGSKAILARPAETVKKLLK